MTATGFLFILIGLFVVVNSTNLVGVLQGNKTFLNNSTGATPSKPKSNG